MSIFNDKALKGVSEAVAKIMEAEKAKMDYDKDGKIESPKDEVWGSRLRAAKLAGKLKEEEQIVEGGMPSSVIKHKQRLATKTPEELHAGFKEVAGRMGKSVEHVARSTAWGHGYGKGEGQGSAHYWNKIKHLETKSESVELDEASYSAKAARAGKDIGKPGKEFSKIAKSAAERYGSEEKGKKVAGAILAKLRKEETEQLDELSKGTLASYAKKAVGDYAETSRQEGEGGPTRSGDQRMDKREKGIDRAISKLASKKTNEEVELDEAFPTVADAKKRMDAGKTSSGTITKTKTGLVHKRDYKDDDNDADDTPKKSKGYGARQNMGMRGQSDGTKKTKTMKEEKLSFTEMLQLYNESGVEVLAKIVPEKVKFGDTEVEVIDADKINGAIETTVVEGASEEQFDAQLKTAEWKSNTKDDDTVRPVKKKANVPGAASLGVKVQQEEVEQIDELSKTTLGSYIKKAHFSGGMADFKHGRMHDKRGDSKEKMAVAKISNKREKGINKAVNRLTKEEVELEERAKWRTSSIAHNTGYRKDGAHGGIENTADTGKEDLLRGRFMHSRYGSPTKSDVKMLKKSITKNLSQMKKEETEQIDEISKELAGKYLTAPQGKGANKYKVSSDKSVYPNIETMSKHSTNVRRALKRSEGSSLYKKPDYYKEEVEQLDEKLPASATAGDYIHDFVHSDNPKFAGKSTKERQKMALGAFYAKNKGK